MVMDKPLRKMSFLALFRTSIFWSKNHSFLSKISNNLYWLLPVFSQKYKLEKIWCLDKNHGLSPLENLAVLHFLKLYIAGLKIVLFYPEYQKTIFSDSISPKNTNRKNFDFWPKKMDYLLRKNHFCRPFKT